MTAHIPYAGGDKRPSTAWHAEFADFNNDGLSDIFVSKGNLEQMPDFAAYDPSNLLLGQWNGKFAEGGDDAGIARNAKGRGALIADFNLDGQLDILQINRGSNALLYRNLGAKNGVGPPLPMGNWSEIRLVEPNPNRNAVGARITIRTGTRSQTRFVDVGGGDASGHSGFIHVGLGTAERAEIGCNGPTANRAHRTACSPTSSSSSTARSHRPLIGIRHGRTRIEASTRLYAQLAITSFTCMIGSIFV